MFPVLDLCGTDPAQHLMTAGYDLDYLDYLDYDLDRDLSVRRVERLARLVHER